MLTNNKYQMKSFAIAALVGLVSANTHLDDTTGIFPKSDSWRSGFVDLNEKDNIFYWQFDSRDSPSEDPLVMWLTGGPGCASEVALFFENGPFTFNEDGKTLGVNPYAWNSHANLLYVDQPIGTGFSHAAKGHGVRTEEKVAEDMELFLKGFLEQTPQFVGRDFYITGESYAGHYVPAIAYHLLFETEIDLNLKTIAIGNGLTDPFHQYPSYAPFSYENGLITEE